MTDLMEALFLTSCRRVCICPSTIVGFMMSDILLARGESPCSLFSYLHSRAGSLTLVALV
jgi:hypothetical protein